MNSIQEFEFLNDRIKIGLCFITGLSLSTTPLLAGPMQSWLTINLGQRLDYGLEAKVEVMNRLENRASPWLAVEVDPELVWHYSPRYDFSLGYEHTEMNTSPYITSDTAFFTGTIKVPVQRWIFTSRQRVELGVQNSESAEVFRQENKLMYRTPWFSEKLGVFVMDEWFFDFEQNQISQNRAAIGISYEINKAWAVEAYAMRLDEWDMVGRNSNNPVLGISTNLNF
jgi:hypothetical protein